MMLEPKPDQFSVMTYLSINTPNLHPLHTHVKVMMMLMIIDDVVFVVSWLYGRYISEMFHVFERKGHSGMLFLKKIKKQLKKIKKKIFDYFE